MFGVGIATQPAFTRSKLTIETLEQGAKYIQTKFDFFLYFPNFRLNMESKSPYSVQMRENTDGAKQTTNPDTFHAVVDLYKVKKLTEVSLNSSLVL